MAVVFALWLRELKRYLRSKTQVIASLGQPLMYLLVLGYGLGRVFDQAGEGSYLQFVAPGVVGMSILFTAIFSGVGVLWDRQFGFLKETLVAPVPRVQVMLGRTLGGATTALIQGMLVLTASVIAGFRPTDWAMMPFALLVMAGMAVTFAALGTAIGSLLKDMQGFQMVMNFLVMPMFFLSGALYPLKGLPVVLVAATHIDPLTYGIDGLRGALIGESHFGLPLDLAVLGGVATLFVVFGGWAFSRIQI